MKRIQIVILSAAMMLLSCGQHSVKEKEQVQNDSLPPKMDTAARMPDTAASVAQAILPDEALVNDLLKTQVGSNWRVLSYKDVKERPSNYDDMIKQERITNPNFPFIIKADLNGDNKTDYAALVTNDEQEFERLLTRVYVFLDGKKAMTFEESTMPLTTLRVVNKADTIEGFINDKDKKIVMKTEGLEVMTGESGGYYLYWDGKAIKMLYALE